MNKTQHWRNERQFARTVRHESKRRDHRKAGRANKKTARARFDFGPGQGGKQQWAFLRLLFALYAMLPQFNFEQRRQPVNYSKRRVMAYESHK